MQSGNLLGTIGKLWPIARMAYRLVMIVRAAKVHRCSQTEEGYLTVESVRTKPD